MSKSDSWRDEDTTAGEASPLLSLRRPNKPYLLEQVQGPGTPRYFALELDEVIIGRSLQAHLSVDSQLLSRKHIALQRRGPEYHCVDLDSKNGMYLNGVKVHSAVLREGDAIQIGDVVLIYHEGS